MMDTAITAFCYPDGWEDKALRPYEFTGSPDIAFTVLDSDWTPEARPRRPKLGQVEDETEGPLSATDLSPDVRTVLRIRREIMLLLPGAQFKESQDEMLFRLGRIQGQLEAALGPNLTTREIKQRANSMFLLKCIQEVKSKEH
jgi:hypothetical protein